MKKLSIGTRVRLYKEEYVLATLYEGQRILSLVNINNGSKWSDPVEVVDMQNITKEDANKLFGGKLLRKEAKWV